MTSNKLPQSKVEKADKYVPPSGWTSSEEEDVDPVLLKEYHRQLSESDCFDLDIRIPSGDYTPYDLKNEDLDSEIGIYGRVALHWYNLQKGSNLQLVRLVKYVNYSRMFQSSNFITMEVMDPANDSPFTFQTCVEQSYRGKKGDFKIVTRVCRIKPNLESSEVDSWTWNEEVDNGFHDGELEWLPEYALTQSGENQQQYYELQESEIQENDWLNLYIQFAYYTKRGKKNSPLKIKKVVVQTHEDVEPSKKLSSRNAIFYITFNEFGDIEDYKAVISRITDGILGHVALEVRVVNMEYLPAKESLVISQESVEIFMKILPILPPDLLISIENTSPTSGIKVLKCHNSAYAYWRISQQLPDSLKVLSLGEAAQPIKAEMVIFKPDVEKYEGIYCGPMFAESEFIDIDSVLVIGLGEENGEAFCEVKSSYGTIKVSTEAMILEVPWNDKVCDAKLAKPRPIITLFGCDTVSGGISMESD